jgi:peptidyl-prolyl cis-trans isomerase C
MKRSLLLFASILAISAHAHAADKVMATVNGKPITKAMVDEHFTQVPATLIAGREEEFRASVIDGLIEQSVVIQEAERQNIQNTADFKQQLQLARDALLHSILLKNHVDATVTDATLQEYYEKVKGDFAQPEVKARHILVDSKAAAEDIIKQLEKGTEFTKLAKEKSKGPSAANGGDLGWFRHEEMAEPFSNAAFAMKKGDYSKTPVQTQYGWHVILVEDKNDNAIPTFSEIEKQLRAQMSEEAVQEYIAELKGKAKIEYNK